MRWRNRAVDTLIRHLQWSVASNDQPTTPPARHQASFGTCSFANLFVCARVSGSLMRNVPLQMPPHVPVLLPMMLLILRHINVATKKSLTRWVMLRCSPLSAAPNIFAHIFPECTLLSVTQFRPFEAGKRPQTQWVCGGGGGMGDEGAETGGERRKTLRQMEDGGSAFVPKIMLTFCPWGGLSSSVP